MLAFTSRWMTASVFFFIQLLQCVIQNIIRAESNSRWMQIIHTNLQSNFKHQSLFCQVIAMSKFSHSLILLCLRWFNYSLDANELNEEKEIEGQREREWVSLELISKIETISEYFELFLKGMECVKLPSEHRTDVNQKYAFKLLMSVDSVQT